MTKVTPNIEPLKDATPDQAIGWILRALIRAAHEIHVKDARGDVMTDEEVQISRTIAIGIIAIQRDMRKNPPEEPGKELSSEELFKLMKEKNEKT